MRTRSGIPRRKRADERSRGHTGGLRVDGEVANDAAQSGGCGRRARTLAEQGLDRDAEHTSKRLKVLGQWQPSVFPLPNRRHGHAAHVCDLSLC